MYLDEEIVQVEVLLIQDLLASFTYPLTNDNKCLQRDAAAFCQDF